MSRPQFPPVAGSNAGVSPGRSMFSQSCMDKMISRMFRKVDDVVWDITTGKIGVLTSSGIATLTKDESGEYEVTVNVMEDFGMPIPAFAQSTPVAALKEGDIIYTGAQAATGGGRISWITEKTGEGEKAKFKTMKPSGESGTFKPPKISMLGFESGVMVLRPLFSMFPGGDKAVNNFSSMMMPLMMMGGMEDGSMERLLPFLLMSQTNDTSGSGGNMGNMMQAMMFAKMMR